MSRAFPALAGLAAMLAAMLFGTGPAEAQLELCNRTSYVLYTATAVHDINSVTTQGWTRIIPGECKTAIDNPLGKNNYYVYARTSTAHGGASRDWGGGTRLCAAQGNFRQTNPLGTVMCAAEATAVPFAQVDTHGMSLWTTTFTESNDITTADAARTAGLKRLLRDNGAKIARIDGKPDAKTGGALSDFRKRMKLAPKANMAAMFDALETEAMKTVAPAGYSVCNDSDGDVWAVIATKEGAAWTTRGWWKIPAGSCAKAISDPLHYDQVFLHTEKHAKPDLVSGKEKFCVTNMQFERQGRGNCAKNGLTEAGFAATPTKGLTGYVAHVGNQGLVAPMKARGKK